MNKKPRKHSASKRRGSAKRAAKRTSRAASAAEPRLDRSKDPEFNEIPHVKQRAYLVALSRNWNFNHAAEAADVDRGTGFNWRNDKADLVFQAALQRAGDMFVERAEAEMWRRGIDGTLKPIYQGGRLVGYERQYDTTAAIFMLKGAKPEKFRERFEHTGKDGAPLFAVTCIPDMGNDPKGPEGSGGD